jgi:hypothetical protein
VKSQYLIAQLSASRQFIMGDVLHRDLMSSDASLIGVPCPDHVTTAAEFMGALRNLRAWANLTYRELESRATQAGDRLPRGTIASAMSRGVMPREQTIAAFVRACGGDRSAVDVWLAARRRIAAADQAVGDLASAVESWISAHLPGTNSRKVRKDRSSRRRGSVQPDLSTVVEAWLLTRGRFRPDRRLGTVYGSRAIGWNRDTVAFYTIVPAAPAVPEALDVDSLLEDTTYNLGRVAQAAAETTSSRWVGLHRRSSRSKVRFSRRPREEEVAAV